LAAVGVCALLFISGVVFPFMLAATPENSELETIETEEVLPAEELNMPDESDIPRDDEQYSEPEHLDAQEPDININAISKEMAIEIAVEAYDIGLWEYECPTTGETRNTLSEVIEAIYMENSDSESSPSWLILIKNRFWGVQHTMFIDGRIISDIYSDLSSLEEYVIAMEELYGDHYSWTIGTNKKGDPVAMAAYDNATYYIIVVDAFHGVITRHIDLIQGVTSIEGISSPAELSPYIERALDVVEIVMGDGSEGFIYLAPEPEPYPIILTPAPTPQPTSMPQSNSQTETGQDPNQVVPTPEPSPQP